MMESHKRFQRAASEGPRLTSMKTPPNSINLINDISVIRNPGEAFHKEYYFGQDTERIASVYAPRVKPLDARSRSTDYATRPSKGHPPPQRHASPISIHCPLQVQRIKPTKMAAVVPVTRQRSPTASPINRPRTASPKKLRTPIESITTDESVHVKRKKKRKACSEFSCQTPIDSPLTTDGKPWRPMRDGPEKKKPKKLKRTSIKSGSSSPKDPGPHSEPILNHEKSRYAYEDIPPSNIIRDIPKLEPVMEEPASKKRKKIKKIDSPKLLGLKKSPDTKKSAADRYPVLNDQDLIKQFLAVTMTNNQKGRIRQVLRDLFSGTDTEILPDLIHTKIQTIRKSSESLNDSDLRKIRILYNMLKVSTEQENGGKEIKTGNPRVAIKELKSIKTPKPRTVKEKSKENDETDGIKTSINSTDVTKDPKLVKEKKEKPRRYIVFVGNLPLDVDEAMLRSHFSDVNTYITSVRLPPAADGKNSRIAYVEVDNHSAYEMALSKHHSMLSKRRINVLYTTQKNSKMSKPEAKAKRAKLLAMGKSGQLTGSIPMAKKRSQRRAKLRKHRKLAEENNAKQFP